MINSKRKGGILNLDKGSSDLLLFNVLFNNNSLYFNMKLKKFDTIYVNGSSLTAGGGLGDKAIKNEYKKLYEETVILVDQATQILADLNQSIELSGIEFSKREKELLQIRLVKKEFLQLLYLLRHKKQSSGKIKG